MKTIGIRGETSAEPTALRCGRLDEKARQGVGGLRSAECVVGWGNCARIEALQAGGDRSRAGEEGLARTDMALERAGAAPDAALRA